MMDGQWRRQDFKSGGGANIYVWGGKVVGACWHTQEINESVGLEKGRTDDAVRLLALLTIILPKLSYGK